VLLQDGLKPEGISKDVWLHQKVKGTSYLTQYDLSEFEDIGAIGLELWQVTQTQICFTLVTFQMGSCTFAQVGPLTVIILLLPPD
jgi:hypothetical protein